MHVYFASFLLIIMIPANTTQVIYHTWRHQMETFSALLALCAGNSLVTDEFPSQRSVTWGFDVFFDLRRHRFHYDVTVMINESSNGSRNSKLKKSKASYSLQYKTTLFQHILQRVHWLSRIDYHAIISLVHQVLLPVILYAMAMILDGDFRRHVTSLQWLIMVFPVREKRSCNVPWRLYSG